MLDRFSNKKINFFQQVDSFLLLDYIKKLKIAKISHMKLNIFIECRVDISIREYFHVRSSLTMFPIYYNYMTISKIWYLHTKIFTRLQEKESSFDLFYC